MKELYKLLSFKNLGDSRGNLVAIEGNTDVPFTIHRTFYIYGCDSNTVRGKHANKNSEFVLINVAGKSKVMVTDGTQKEIIELSKPSEALYIPKMVWKEMYDFSPDSVLLILTNTHYDSSEYIRDFDEYKELMDSQSEN